MSDAARPWVALFVAGLVAACANSPMAIGKMTPDELTTVPDRSLCYAYATRRRDREVTPMLQSEVDRRGLGCEEALAHMISDCSSLAIVSSEVVERGTIYTVRNNGGQARNFRAVNNNIVSTLQTVRPGQTVRFGVESSAPLTALGGAVAMAQGTAGIRLQECKVPW